MILVPHVLTAEAAVHAALHGERRVPHFDLGTGLRYCGFGAPPPFQSVFKTVLGTPIAVCGRVTISPGSNYTEAEFVCIHIGLEIDDRIFIRICIAVSPCRNASHSSRLVALITVAEDTQSV